MTDEEKYYKLRWLMSGNVKETWNVVSELASIACYVDWEAFDEELEAVDTSLYSNFLCGKYNYKETKHCGT